MLFQTRVLHLIETRPRQTWKKFRANRRGLYEDVQAAVKAALKHEDQLQQKGTLNDYEIEELIYNDLAPRDVMPDPNPLNERRQEMIYEWAIDPPESRTATT